LGAGQPGPPTEPGGPFIQSAGFLGKKKNTPGREICFGFSGRAACGGLARAVAKGRQAGNSPKDSQPIFQLGGKRKPGTKKGGGRGGPVGIPGGDSAGGNKKNRPIRTWQHGKHKAGGQGPPGQRFQGGDGNRGNPAPKKPPGKRVYRAGGKGESPLI